MKHWLFLSLLCLSGRSLLLAQQDSIPAKSPVFKAGFYLGTSYSVSGKPEWGYELGLRTTFRLSRFFLFSTGLSYSEIRYHTNLFGGNQYYNGDPYILDESTKEFSFNMPLTILARLQSGKFEYYAGIGAEVTMFYKYQDDGKVTINGQTKSPGELGLNYSELDFCLRPGLTFGLNYRKNSKMDFFAEGGVKNVKFGYGYFSNLYTVYFNTGIMYSLFTKSNPERK